MFSPFTSGDGSPSWDALLEQTCMFQALTFNNEPRRDQVLSICGGGTVLAWQWATGEWPPSMSLIRQGNVLYVCVTGTENLAQLYGDVIGAFAENYPTFGCKIHRFFRRAWGSVKARIVASLPLDWHDCEFRFFGHSLGAAVAFLGAVEWKQENPAMRVDFLGLAMPKSLTTGYSGPLPNTCNFAASPEDVVPLMPSNGMHAVVYFVNPAAWFSLPMNWVHYANGYIMQGGNAPLTRGTADDFNWTPNPITLATTAVEHFGATYLAKIIQGWSQFVATGRNVALLPVANQLVLEDVTQTQVNNIDAWNQLDVPAANLTLFGSAGPGPLTNDNLGQVESISGGVLRVTRGNSTYSRLPSGSIGMGVKVTFFLRDSLGEFTESWYKGGASVPGDVTAAMLAAYLRDRMPIAGAQTTFVKVRVSTVGTARAVQVWYEADIRAGSGIVWSATGTAAKGAHSAALEADFVATSLLCRKVGAGLRNAPFFLRGIPDEICQTGGLYKPYPAFIRQFGDFRDTLTGGGWSWRGVSGGPTTATVSNAVTQADSTCIITLAAAMFTGIAAGTKQVVRITGQVSPKNLNGQITVQVITDTTCRTIHALSVNNFVLGTGRMTRKGLDYVAINDLRAERIVSRKAGVPSDLSRGRSPAHAKG